MQSNNQHLKPALYWLLLAIQIVGAISLVWQELPKFGQVLDNPGEQLPKNTKADLMVAGVFFVMQIAFWIRVRSVPIPFRRPNMFLNHVFLFLSRLSFIFGSALFSVVIFRHLPKLSHDADFLLMAQRGAMFVSCLFALFCASLEVERLGQSFESNRN
jgi:hypothetical protein